jgi:hypothetical protein
VLAACTPVAPDFSAWTRRQVAGVTIAVPPGWIVEQGPPTNIGIRNAARRSYAGFGIHERSEAKENYDFLYYRQRKYRNACRTNLSGYPADVIASYDRGQYNLFAFWQAEWGGKDAGKWLSASITSTRVEEATELRALLHTVQPAGTDQ